MKRLSKWKPMIPVMLIWLIFNLLVGTAFSLPESLLAELLCIRFLIPIALGLLIITAIEEFRYFEQIERVE